MANDKESPKGGNEARKKRVRREEGTVKLVPSVAETGETWAWLSTSLRNELQQDLDESDGQQEGPALRDADIDLSSLQIVTSGEVLRAKIKDALVHWDKLAERIPLKRHRPAGLSGKVAGSDDMFLDFDIHERDVPRHPPSGANEVHLYQYYVQRLLCTVPRADWLRARTTEGRVPLRAHRVKAHLDTFHTKKPYGDRCLLKETNYAYKGSHRNVNVREGAARKAVPDPAAAVAAGDGTAVLGSGVLPGSGAAVTTGGAVTTGAATATAIAAPSAKTSRSGNSGDGGSGGASSSTAAAVSATAGGGDGIVQCFSGPSRAVVTFALYRSAAKGKGLKLQGHLPEKRLFEVEALEQNTLQQIMEAMPPCLADRIVEEYRAGGCDEDRDDGASLRASAAQKGISLAGGLLFIRGVFYVTRPAEGEDASHAPLPPPPQPRRVTRVTARAAAKEAAAAKVAAKAAAARAAKQGCKTKNAANSTQETPEPPSSAHNAETPAGGPPPPPRRPPTPTPPEPPGPPEPWMKRWLQVGHVSWNTDKEELLKLAEKRRRQQGRGQGDRGGGGGDGETQTRRRERPRGRETVSEREKGKMGAQEEEREEGDDEEEEEEKEGEWGPRASLEGVSAGAAPGLASASALAARRTSAGSEGEAAGKGKGKGKSKSKSKGKEKGKRKGGARGAATTEEQKDGEGGEEREEETGENNTTAAGGAPAAAAGNSAASGASRKRKRPEAAGATAGGKDRSTARTGKGTGGGSGDAGLTTRSMLGVTTKRKLGMGADGGKVVWAADATVGDLRPVLGERYMFLHNRVCDHVFVVSDMRMEPVPASAPPSNTVAAPAAAATTTTTTIPVAGPPTLEYPRLSFRTKPNSRRCGVCHTKTAVKASIGHPLSDKAPLACCEECFEMLYYDADQNLLEGELAGETTSASCPGDRNAEKPGQGIGGQVVGGPKGWKMFGCYDEY